MNIFSILKIDEKEATYTRFLVWLLNPKNGKFSENFLKEFLRIFNPTNSFTLSNFEVQCEYTIPEADLKSRMDIFLINRNESFVCVIENKVNSRENGSQLNNYQEIVNKHFQFFGKLFVYLTVEGFDKEGYMALKHTQVSDILKSLIQNDLNLEGINHKSVYIEDYISMVESKTEKLSKTKNSLEKLADKVLESLFYILNNDNDILASQHTIKNLGSQVYFRFMLKEFENIIPSNKGVSDWLLFLELCQPTQIKNVRFNIVFVKIDNVFCPPILLKLNALNLINNKFKVVEENKINDSYNHIYEDVFISKEEYENLYRSGYEKDKLILELEKKVADLKENILMIMEQLGIKRLI